MNRALLVVLACGALSALSACGASEDVGSEQVLERLASADTYAQLPHATLDSVWSPCAVPTDCVTAALRVSSTDSAGRVAFLGLDGKKPQVYLIDPRDRVPQAKGRVGAGPGEYRGVHRLGFSENGDLVVFDLLFRRFVRYASASGDTTTAQLPMPATFLEAMVSDGRVLVLATEPVDRSGDSARVVLYHLEPGAAKPSELARLNLRQPSWRMEDMRPMPSALDAQAAWAVATDGSVLHTSGARFVVTRFTRDGSAVLRYGFDVEPRAVGSEDLADASSSAMRGITDATMREAASVRAGSATARRVPAISGVVAASDGGTWAREWPRASLDSVSWVRFDASGAPVHRVVLGTHDALLDSNGDRILLTQSGGARDPDLLRWARLRVVTAK